MLTEPIVLNQSATDQSYSLSLSRVDTDNGRSVYRVAYDDGTQNSGSGVGRLELTIGNTVTNENKPYKTDRTLVRIDLSLPTQTNPIVETKGSAYLVISTPRGDGVKALHTKQLVNMLLRFLGGVTATPSGVTNATSLASAQTLTARLLNGET